jgi:phosphoglycerol transferase MdoB-like AlkP superfamily enzyme
VSGGAIAAVLLGAIWVAHLCVRCHPDWRTVVINLSFWLVPVALLIASTGEVWKSIGFGTALVVVFQRLHWLKWKYLLDTWTAADFHLLVDRANWLVVRRYPFIAGFLLACVAGLALSWLLMPAGPPLSVQARLSAFLLAATLVAFDVRHRNHHVFDPFGFNIYGHFANLLFSMSSLKYCPPTVTSDSRLFRERAAQLPPRGVRLAARPPDIVVWLQESATDPRIFDIGGVTMPGLAMHVPDARTRESGWLRVPTWGGNTWLTEFALLTGLSHRDFGAAGLGVFYTVTPRLRYSLPKLLRSRGYHGVVMFPLDKTFYNADSAYHDLGFDEVLTPLDFPEWGNKSLLTHTVQDQDLFSYAMQILSRPRSQPMFVFVLSMSQHGPYDATHEVGFGLERSSLDRPTAGRMSDWLTRMEKLSLDAVDFDERLRASGRDLVLSYFGDHQPNLESPLPLRGGLHEPRFLTRFTIKSRDPVHATGDPEQVLDACFLGSLLLEHAGIAADDLFAASASMRRLCGGQLGRCVDPALVESYRAHVYHDLAAAAGVTRGPNAEVLSSYTPLARRG